MPCSSIQRSEMVSVTITYRQPGTQPPMFVAGSFSDPQWEPQEMQFSVEEGGEHTFFKTIDVPPRSQIQYKFRVGLGDWWVLNEDAITITDHSGNRNNLLTAPAAQEYGKLNGVRADGQDPGAKSTAASTKVSSSDAGTPATAQMEPSSKAVSHLKDEDRQRLSSTPIEQVADTAAEVADTAEKIDAHDNMSRFAPPSSTVYLKEDERKHQSSTPVEQVANVAAEVADSAQMLDADVELDDKDLVDDGPPPLFAHEALGQYESPTSGSEGYASKDIDHHGNVEYDVDTYDLNDPALERLPPNRNGIMDAVRKVETGRNEDLTHFHGSPLSPVVGSRRPNFDPFEEAVLSPGPSSPGFTKKLGLPRKSHGSMVSERSLASLGSIAEEEGKESSYADAGNSEDEGPIRIPSPAIRPTPHVFTSPASDEDEGVVMKGTKSKSKKNSESVRSGSPDVNGDTSGNHSGDLSPKTQPVKRDSPSICIQTPEDAAPTSGVEASSTGRDYDHKGQLKKRGGSSSTERPGTPSSIHSVADSKGNWLRAFFRVVFLDWIGGVFSRLFGSKRRAMLATSTAAIVVGVAWWKFAADGDLSWLKMSL